MNNPRCFSLARRLLVVTIICILALSPILPVMTKTVEAQGGSLDSTIPLQMPFIAGETWIVGGTGYFYGEVDHSNNCCFGSNDYYATDWNRVGDDGSAVLPVANGTVTDVRVPPCGNLGFGCFVQVDHANGYRTKYAHLQAVYVAIGTVVRTSTLLGLVGSTGSSSGAHLHLTFRHNDGGYFSYCWNGGNTCPNNEPPQWPQGHRPSPMLAAAGNVTLVDVGSYTSVNGRLYLADLETPAGWSSTIYIRNNGTQARTVTVKYFTPAGINSDVAPPCTNLAPGATCQRTGPINFLGTAYIEGAENISAVALLQGGSRAYALEAVPSGGLHGGLGTGPVGYMPSYLVNYYGWNSTLLVQNASSTSVYVDAYLYNDTGINPVGSVLNRYIPAFGQTIISLSGTASGSVRVVSRNLNVPLAIMVKHTHATIDTIAYAGGVAGGTSNYAPSLLKNYATWNAAYTTQETGGNGGSFTAYYIPSGYTPFSLNAFGRKEVYMGAEASFPDGASGAGWIVRSSGSAMIFSAVHQSTSVNAFAQGYPLVTVGSKLLYLPWVRKNFNFWDASVTVYNVGSATTSVTLEYRDASGNPVGVPWPYTFDLAANAKMELWSQLPNGAYSIMISATNSPIVAVAHGNDTGGRANGYTAIP